MLEQIRREKNATSEGRSTFIYICICVQMTEMLFSETIERLPTVFFFSTGYFDHWPQTRFYLRKLLLTGQLIPASESHNERAIYSSGNETNYLKFE